MMTSFKKDARNVFGPEKVGLFVQSTGLHDAFKRICEKVLLENPENVFEFAAKQLKAYALFKKYEESPSFMAMPVSFDNLKEVSQSSSSSSLPSLEKEKTNPISVHLDEYAVVATVENLSGSVDVSTTYKQPNNDNQLLETEENKMNESENGKIQKQENQDEMETRLSIEKENGMLENE